VSEFLGWTPDVLARLHALRGWTPAALDSLNVTYNGASGTVGIPITDATGDDLGELTYQPDPSRRPNGGPKMRAPSGVPRQLFPPPESIGSDVGSVLLLEGEGDPITAASYGYAAVGVPGTNGWRDEYAARFAGRRWTVYVVFDCDDVGRAAARAIVRSLIALGVDARLVGLDATRDDGYDLTDFLTEHGRDEFDALLDETPFVSLADLELIDGLFPPAAYQPVEDSQPWHAQTWAEFRDATPPAFTWLIDELLPAGALAFVAGPPKKGKTWIGLLLSLVVASGRPLLDTYTVPEAQAVLYAALEGSATGLRARIGALSRGLELDPDGDDLARLHVLYRPRPFNLADLADATWLADESDQLDARLVVVDVLRAAARFQENSAEDFARIRAGLDPLLAAGRTVLLLHHFGKASDTLRERSPGERMAGTGAMYGALDVGYLIAQSSDGATRMRVDVEARDFAAPDALAIQLTGNGSGPHGGFTYTDTVTVRPDTGDVVADVLAYFDANPSWITGDDLARELNIDRKATLEPALLEDDSDRPARKDGSPWRRIKPGLGIVRLEAGHGIEGIRGNALPYGSDAMYDALLESRASENEINEKPGSGRANPVSVPLPKGRGGRDNTGSLTNPGDSQNGIHDDELRAVPDDDEDDTF
jgi:hypothetical protein